MYQIDLAILLLCTFMPVVISTSDSNIVAGTNYSWNCTYDDPELFMKIRIYKDSQLLFTPNGGKLINDERFTFDGDATSGLLNITMNNLTCDDHGFYYCKIGDNKMSTLNVRPDCKINYSSIYFWLFLCLSPLTLFACCVLFSQAGNWNRHHRHYNVSNETLLSVSSSSIVPVMKKEKGAIEV